MIRQIHPWSFPSKATIPDGYHERQIPQPTFDNLEFLAEEHNKLVRIINKIIVMQPLEVQQQIIDFIDEEQ